MPKVTSEDKQGGPFSETRSADKTTPKRNVNINAQRRQSSVNMICGHPSNYIYASTALQTIILNPTFDPRS